MISNLVHISRRVSWYITSLDCEADEADRAPPMSNARDNAINKPVAFKIISRFQLKLHRTQVLQHSRAANLLPTPDAGYSADAGGEKEYVRLSAGRRLPSVCTPAPAHGKLRCQGAEAHPKAHSKPRRLQTRVYLARRTFRD